MKWLKSHVFFTSFNAMKSCASNTGMHPFTIGYASSEARLQCYALFAAGVCEKPSTHLHMIYARGGWQRDGTAKNKQAKQAIQQNIQQFLTEIGQMAKEAEQTETDQSLKQLANQIGTLSTQIKFNDQTQGQL